MKNIISGLILVFSAQAAVAGEFNDLHAGSRFEALKAGFEAASAPLTQKELLGGYLGRCYSPESDTPMGMVLTTDLVTVSTPSDEGPLFPPYVTKTWRMAIIYKGVITDTNASDSITQEDAINYWNKQKLEDFQLSVENSVATSSIGIRAPYIRDPRQLFIGKSTYQVKKASDGKLFLRNRAEGKVGGVSVPSTEGYCYFWKKQF